MDGDDAFVKVANSKKPRETQTPGVESVNHANWRRKAEFGARERASRVELSGFGGARAGAILTNLPGPRTDCLFIALAQLSVALIKLYLLVIHEVDV